MDENYRFRELRKALGLTLSQFGAVLGMSQSALSAIEAGQNKVIDRHRKLIKASFPNVNIEWLQTGLGDMFVQTDSDLIAKLESSYNLDPLIVRMLRLFVQLPDDKRQVITDYLRSVVQSVEDDELRADLDALASDPAQQIK